MITLHCDMCRQKVLMLYPLIVNGITFGLCIGCVTGLNLILLENRKDLICEEEYKEILKKISTN